MPEPKRKVLVLFAHPALQKSRVNRRLIRETQELDGVLFHDLYEEYPRLDIDASREQDDRPSDVLEEDNPVIIAGFGDFGNVVGRLLWSNDIGCTVLDNDSDRVEILRKPAAMRHDQPAYLSRAREMIAEMERIMDTEAFAEAASIRDGAWDPEPMRQEFGETAQE